MESSQKRQPFDFKIKELKRYLKKGGMGKHEINATVKLYKQRVYDRVAEVKAKMEKELDEKLNVSETNGMSEPKENEYASNK